MAITENFKSGSIKNSPSTFTLHIAGDPTFSLTFGPHGKKDNWDNSEYNIFLFAIVPPL